MDQKIRLMLAGSVIGLLVVVALYLSFCSGGPVADKASVDAANAAAKANDEGQKAAPPIEVPPRSPEIRSKSGFPRK